MSTSGRSEVQQEVASALIDSNAINFDSIAGILAKFGPRAALTGSGIHVSIGRRVFDLCIPPEPYDLSQVLQGRVQERG